MKHLIDAIFTLPPVDKRINIEGTLFKKAFLPKRARSDRNDTYILYQIAFFAFWIFFLTGMVLLSARYLPNLEAIPTLATFRSKDLQTVQTFYIWTCEVIFVLGLLPFFLTKYLKNVDINKEDIFWSNDYYIKSGGFTKTALLFRSSLAAIMFLLIAYAVTTLPDTNNTTGGRMAQLIAPLLRDNALSFSGLIILVSGTLTTAYSNFIMSCLYFYKGCVSATADLKRPLQP